jgi:hypothetical protein
MPPGIAQDETAAAASAAARIRIKNEWLFTPYGDTIMPLCGYNSHI